MTSEEKIDLLENKVTSLEDKLTDYYDLLDRVTELESFMEYLKNKHRIYKHNGEILESYNNDD